MHAVEDLHIVSAGLTLILVEWHEVFPVSQNHTSSGRAGWLQSALLMALLSAGCSVNTTQPYEPQGRAQDAVSSLEAIERELLSLHSELDALEASLTEAQPSPEALEEQLTKLERHREELRAGPASAPPASPDP